MLHDGELGQDLGVEHLDHALVDLAPAVLDARHVIEDGTVFPEGPFLDVVDEADGGEIHVRLPEPLYCFRFEDIARFRSPLDGALEGHGLILGNRAGELCRPKDIWHKRVVVESPDTVRTCWLEIVCEDETTDHAQVPECR